MAPLENDTNPLTGGLNSPDSSFRAQALHNNDNEDRHPASPSIQYARSWSNAKHDGELPPVPSLSWSDRNDDTESQIRIRKLRRN
jgi:hypothetical protein